MLQSIMAGGARGRERICMSWSWVRDCEKDGSGMIIWRMVRPELALA